MTYDSTITIINQTGIAMTLGTFTADYGDWSVSPTDIASTNPTSMTFTVTADSTNSNGSQGTVHYTFVDDSQEKISIKFACTSANTNFVKVKDKSDAYDVTYSVKASSVEAEHPLVDTITITQSDS